MTAAAQREALFEYLLRLGDNCLILGHRLSEWCGKGPVLEEDIALSNIALDLVGQSKLWLELAAKVEGTGRDADALAFKRDVLDWRNFLLVEQPNGDFAETIVRQFLFDCFHVELLQALTKSAHQDIADIAADQGGGLSSPSQRPVADPSWRRYGRKPGSGAGRAGKALGLYARAVRWRCHRRDDDAGRDRN